MKRCKNLPVLTGLLIIMLAVFLVLGCANGSGEAVDQQQQEVGTDEEAVMIKVGYIAPPDHSYAYGFEKFAEAVTEKTDGRVVFDIYGGGELGGEREVIEQTTLGTVDMTLVTTAPLTGFVPQLSVFDLPFLFKDEAHAYAVLDGDIGQDVLDQMADANLKGIAFWENGFRHLTNTERPIRSPSDMQGLKMRSMEGEIASATFKALGVDTVPISFPELYTSIEQGVIHGHDNAYGVLESTGVHEVTNYLSEVGMYYASATLVMNMDTFQSLPKDAQETIVQLGKEYAHEQRQINQEMEAEQRAFIEEHGMEIIDAGDIDMDAFREAVETVYEDYWDEYGAYVERIREMQ